MSKRYRPARAWTVRMGLLVPIVFVGSLGLGLLARNSELIQDLFGDGLAPETIIAEGDARAAALAKLSELHPDLTGWVIERVKQESVTTARDSDGLLRAEFVPAVDGFLYELRARGTGEFTAASGLVVVNATTGEIEAADVMEYNP